jgi:hypothetical protein
MVTLVTAYTNSIIAESCLSELWPTPTDCIAQFPGHGLLNSEGLHMKCLGAASCLGLIRFLLLITHQLN